MKASNPCQTDDPREIFVNKVLVFATVIAFAALICAQNAVAHHSVGAFYDQENVKTIEGKITRIRWANPHIKITVETVGEDGRRETWKVESGSINALERDGVTRDSMGVGDTVEISGFPSRRGRPRDGRRFGVARGWSGNRNVARIVRR